MKKLKKLLQEQKKWDELSEETQSFVEAQDEYLKQFAEVSDLEVKIRDFMGEFAKSNGKGLSEEQMTDLSEVITGFKTLSQDVKKMKDEGVSGNSFVDPFRKALEDNAEKLKDFKSKKIRDLELKDIPFYSKTATPSDIAAHTIGMRVPGIGQLPVRQPFMFDIFPVVPTTLEYVKYIDQETIARDAKNCIDINAITPASSVTWKERSIQIMKTKDFIHASVDMIEDYDFVQGELNNLINTSVILKVDDNLLNGDGSSPNWHGVDEIASEFDASNTLGGTIPAWAGTVKEPNIYDLIVAMASQIIAAGKDSSWVPNFVLVNTIDKYKNMLIKDSQGRYLLPPFVTVVNNKEVSIDGMQIRSNPNVPANSLFVMDSTKGTIYMRKGFGMEMSYENGTNFQTETVTIKGYMRGNLLIRNVNANAFMKCTDITSALADLAVASV